MEKLDSVKTLEYSLVQLLKRSGDRIYLHSSTVLQAPEQIRVFPRCGRPLLPTQLKKGAKTAGPGVPLFSHCPFEKKIKTQVAIVEKPGRRFEPAGCQVVPSGAGNGPKRGPNRPTDRSARL